MKGDKVEYVINLRLEGIFSVFREKEKIQKGVFTETLGFRAIDIYRVLMNRCYKRHNNIEPSDLEAQVADEAGKLIRAYMKREFNFRLEKYKELGQDIPKSLPYPVYDVTLEDLKERIENYQRTIGSQNQ